MNNLTHLFDFLRTPYVPCKTCNCTGIIATGVNHAKSFIQGTRKEEMLFVFLLLEQKFPRLGVGKTFPLLLGLHGELALGGYS
jgi:hypothetical protein